MRSHIEHTYRIWQADTGFMVAVLTQAPVSVWHQYNDYPEGKIQDYGGIVEGYHSGMVKKQATVLDEKDMNIEYT